MAQLTSELEALEGRPQPTGVPSHELLTLSAALDGKSQPGACGPLPCTVQRNCRLTERAGNVAVQSAPSASACAHLSCGFWACPHRSEWFGTQPVFHTGNTRCHMAMRHSIAGGAPAGAEHSMAAAARAPAARRWASLSSRWTGCWTAARRTTPA